MYGFRHKDILKEEHFDNLSEIRYNSVIPVKISSNA